MEISQDFIENTIFGGSQRPGFAGTDATISRIATILRDYITRCLHMAACAQGRLKLEKFTSDLDEVKTFTPEPSE